MLKKKKINDNKTTTNKNQTTSNVTQIQDAIMV